MIKLDPKEYWLGILNSYDGDHQKVKEIILSDRVSLGVVAALLLAINVSAITTVQNTELSNWQLMSVLIHAASGMLSLSCVWLSMQQYLKVNMLSPANAIEYKLLMKWYDEPVGLLTSSIVTLPPALGVTIYVAYGFRFALYAGCVIAIVALYSIFVVFRAASNYHRVMNNRRTGSDQDNPL